jgi:hypothetical protein
MLKANGDLKKHELKDSIKAVAMDIGKEVACYIEVMYPEAVEACSSTFLLSVRNTTYNKIMAALDPKNQADVAETLAGNARFRRHWRAAWKRIYSQPERLKV